MPPDLVPIASDRISAAINPLGAELWSLRDGAGRNYLTDADPAFWTGHAPLLFPIVGALNGGTYRLGACEYALPRHGFARTSRFALVAHDAASATFRLTDSPETRASWPFAFQLDMVFTAEGDTLRTEARVTNPDTCPLWFSFGFHPAFAWPLPGGAAREAHRLVFADCEPEPVRRLDPASGLVLPGPQPTPVDGDTLAPTPALFESDALIMDGLRSRRCTWGAPGGSRLELHFPDSPMLGIWQKPGAAFLCIEPWQGLADPVGFAGDFRVKPGMVELDGGGTCRFRMDLRVIPG
ncbi:aldose 1-epimerase family protein [Novosphingobium bradum]|uniref:Aldose 1-epimerase family protein n=1 Tax=Novosphingobium bradum TaxID=1737444 RepID=A0ABV7IQH2_9SPHN